MKNRCIIRKYAAIIALSVSSVWFLPEALLAQGAVVGYADGQMWISDPLSAQGFPSDAQLDRLTHVIALPLGCYSNGALKKVNLPGNWTGNRNDWLASLAGRAHAKGVKVSICVGGDYFAQAIKILP